MTTTELKEQLADQQRRRQALAHELPLAQGALAGTQEQLTQALGAAELGDGDAQQIRHARSEHDAALDRIRSVEAAIRIIDTRISDTQQAIDAARAAEKAAIAERAAAKLATARISVQYAAESFAEALNEFARLEAASRDGNYLTGVALMRAAGNPIEVLAQHGVTLPGDVLTLACTRRGRLSDQELLAL